MVALKKNIRNCILHNYKLHNFLKHFDAIQGQTD